MPYISFPTFAPRFLVAGSRAGVKPEMKTAGIIGGLGPQSTSLFYEAFTRYCLDHQLPAYPRLLINSVNAWAVTEILKERDMDQLLAFLKREARLIARQADFLVMVCNSVHAVLEPLRRAVGVPVLSIHEEVVKEVAITRIRKVGVIGTATTMRHTFYQDELARYGIAHARLPVEREAELDAFIFEEMLHGRGEGTMRRLLLDAVQYMADRGCEGVILGCTELPLFIRQEDTPLPLFSSTHILARRVMEVCLGSFAGLAEN